MPFAPHRSMEAEPVFGFGVPGSYPMRVEGVLSRRFFAYAIDLVFIGLLTLLLGFLVAVAGVFTLGFAWGLYAILVPGALLLYSAVTVGSAAQATIGMRIVGLQVLDASGSEPVGGMRAALHALMFYVAASTMILLVADIVIALARDDRRMGHDLVAGMILVRRG